MKDIDEIDALEFDTSEGDEPSEWEKRFENQINTFFDEAIERVPGFVDRHLTSFKRIMGRSVSPKTGLGDVVVSLRNLMSSVSSSLGGPDFSRETYTDEELTRAFEREVVSPEELEGLIRRLFREFERDQWDKLESSDSSDQLQTLLHHRLAQFSDLEPEELQEELDDNPGTMREHMETVMEREIAHDPLLAQVIRSGVKIGLPATLGYVLFGKVGYAGDVGSQAASKFYRRRLDLYNRALMRLGQYQVPGWVGAVGWASGLVGTLAIGGLMEFAVNSIRDVKGSYIRQLNAARYVLLYGEDPETPEGQGLIHLVRGLERQFDRLPELSDDILDDLEELDRIVEETDGETLETPEDVLRPDDGIDETSSPFDTTSGGSETSEPTAGTNGVVEGDGSTANEDGSNDETSGDDESESDASSDMEVDEVEDSDETESDEGEDGSDVENGSSETDETESDERGDVENDASETDEAEATPSEDADESGGDDDSSEDETSEDSDEAEDDDSNDDDSSESETKNETASTNGS
jgi:hypothetical protein